MFEQGHEDFDIEVSTDLTDDLDEETYEDDDEFYEEYGEMWFNEDDIMDEAEYQGRTVKLGKPMQGDVKKFKVYVKDPKTGNTKKVNFGHGGSSVKGKAMSIKKNNPAARRHSEQDTIVIIQDRVLRHVTGHVGSGNMRIDEFAQHHKMIVCRMM